MGALVNSTKYLKKQFSNSLQFLSEDRSKGVFSNSFCEGSIALIPNQDKGITRKETSSHEHGFKSPQENMGKSYSTMCLKKKKVRHHKQVDLLRYTSKLVHVKSIHVIEHIKRLREKNHMVISTDIRKGI